MEASHEPAHDGSSFGISKIIDVKIDKGGRQLYKVKWEPTWEPAENLATCQHLIDKFWSFVNKIKMREIALLDIQKRKKIDPVAIDSINKLSEDNKADVQRLIARTNATTIGTGVSMIPNIKLTTPSDRLMSSSDSLISSGKDATSSDQMAFENRMLISQRKLEPEDISKVVSPSSQSKTSSSTINSSTFKYIKNFSNPYVKIVLVCVICNKEQNHSQAHWKRHYLTHVSDEEKPHKCHICQKAFVQAVTLKRHLLTHEKFITPKLEEQYPID